MQNSYLRLILLVFLTLTMSGCTSTTESKPTSNLLPTQTVPPDPAPSLAPTAAAILETIRGSFRNQISILEKNMPRADSEKYVIPTARQQADFANLVSLIYAGDLAPTVALAGDLNYTLSYYVDRGDDYAMSYLLREIRPIEKGWGLYALRMDSTSNIIVEAPHPLYDRRTPSVALDIYRALDARALLVAGAHRNANNDGSADVAHAPESVFHCVHQSLSQAIETTSGKAVILQIHGFHSNKHEGYPQAVIGFGEDIHAAETTLAKELDAALSEQGIRVGLCTDDAWKSLCGQTSSQGAASNGGIFIHLELDEKIRKNDDALIAALLQVFGQ